jgi:hypothetical protein
MHRPPRAADRPIVTGFGIWRIIFVGLRRRSSSFARRAPCGRLLLRRKPARERPVFARLRVLRYLGALCVADKMRRGAPGVIRECLKAPKSIDASDCFVCA